MTPPKAFVSYSHDSVDHKAWVLRLSTDLRKLGIDVTLDRWDLSVGQDVSLFMERGIAEADRVLMVCSSEYVRKAEAGSGGVGFERLIVTAEMVQSIDTIKFIPVLRGSDPMKRVPRFLGTRLYVDFEKDVEYASHLEELAREIHGMPAITKPPLGLNPFSSVPSGTVHRALGPVGAILNPEKLFDGDWFAEHRAEAEKGIRKLNLIGEVELRFAISHNLSKSQIDLVDAVRQSEIRTFGWPIGVLLENREEFRPRPYDGGIKTEISLGGKESGSRTSYDYWSLGSNGDFYLLQNLFEDTRAKNKLFFDTRIVRATESLMFAEGIYSKLGAPPETKVGVRIAHRGLRGRALTSASQNRFIAPNNTTQEEKVESEVVSVLGTMNQTRVDDVKKLLEPLFMLFDFQQFSTDVYEEIVRNFERGRVT